MPLASHRVITIVLVTTIIFTLNIVFFPKAITMSRRVMLDLLFVRGIIPFVVMGILIRSIVAPFFKAGATIRASTIILCSFILFNVPRARVT